MIERHANGNGRPARYTLTYLFSVIGNLKVAINRNPRRKLEMTRQNGIGEVLIEVLVEKIYIKEKCIHAPLGLFDSSSHSK